MIDFRVTIQIFVARRINYLVLIAWRDICSKLVIVYYGQGQRQNAEILSSIICGDHPIPSGCAKCLCFLLEIDGELR